MYSATSSRLTAFELNHTLQYVVRREQSIIQTKGVVVTALLALARKRIILDPHDISAGHLPGDEWPKPGNRFGAET